MTRRCALITRLPGAGGLRMRSDTIADNVCLSLVHLVHSFTYLIEVYLVTDHIPCCVGDCMMYDNRSLCYEYNITTCNGLVGGLSCAVLLAAHVHFTCGCLRESCSSRRTCRMMLALKDMCSNAVDSMFRNTWCVCVCTYVSVPDTCHSWHVHFWSKKIVEPTIAFIREKHVCMHSEVTH